MRFESKSVNMMEDRDSKLGGSHASVYCFLTDSLPCMCS